MHQKFSRLNRGTILGLALVAMAVVGCKPAKGGDRAGKKSEYIGTSLFRPKSLERLFISADGKVLVSAGGTEVAVWDPGTGRQRRRFEAWSGKASLSADGKRVALLDFGFMGSSIRVHASSSGKLVRSWKVEEAHQIGHLALDRDGSLLAVAMDSGNIELRPVNGERKTKILAGNEGEFRCLAFSPVEKHRLLSGGKKGQLKLWDVRSGQAKDLSAGKKSIMAVGFSPDGKTLVAADSDGFVRLYGSDDGKQVRRFLAKVPNEPGEIRGVAVTDGARRVMVGTWSGVIALWDPTGPKLVSVLGEGGLVAGAVALTPDGKTAIGGVNWGAIRFWDTTTGEERPHMEPGNLTDTDALVWSADGRRAVVAAGGKWANVWDLRTRKLMGRLQGHTRRVEQLAATPDGRLIATGANDGWVRLWDGRSMKELHAARCHSRDVDSLTLSRDGKRLASGGYHGHLVVRDTKSFGVIFERDEEESWDSIFALALSADGSLLVTGDTMGKVEWVDVATGAPLAIRSDDYASNIRSIVFSPDGKLLATTASDKVRVFQTATADLVVTFSGPGWSTTNAAWFPDSRRLAFGDSDGHLWVVDAKAGRVLQGRAVDKLNIRALALRADGKQLLTGHRNTTLRLWNPARLPKMKRGQELELEIERTSKKEINKAHPLPRSARVQCAGQKATDSAVGPLPDCAVARLGARRFRLENALEEEAGVLRFSPDGKLLAAGCSERLRVFEMPSGRVKHLLPCCMAAPVAGMFSPAGRYLAVSPYVGATQMWDLDQNRRVATWEYRARMLAVSQDGSLWAGATKKGTIRVGDRQGSATRKMPVEQLLPVQRLAFSPDGKRLLALRASQVVNVWDVEQAKPLWTTWGGEEELPAGLQEGMLLWAGFDDQGRIAMTSWTHRYVRSEDKTWEAQPLASSLDGEGSLYGEDSVPCSDDGQVCAVRFDEHMLIGSTGGKKRQLRVGEADRFAFNGSGTILALAQDEDVTLWDVGKAKRLSPAPEPAAFAPVSLAKNGTLLTLHEDEMRLWRLPAQKPTRRIKTKTLQSRLSRDGRQVLSVVEDKGLMRIDARSGKPRPVAKGKFTGFFAPSLDFKRVALLEEGKEGGYSIKVLDARSGKTLLSRPGPESTYDFQMALSADGSRLAVSVGPIVDLLSVQSGMRLAQIDVEHDVHLLAFTPDGRWLISGGLSHMDVYSAKNGAYVGHMGDHANVQSVAFSDDGRLLVSGGLDNLVRVFDAKRMRLLAVLPGHERWVHSVAVSDDPPRAVSLDAGGILYQWDLSPWAR